ncbi:hypothetical protein, partial [Roseiflexus sp.]
MFSGSIGAPDGGWGVLVGTGEAGAVAAGMASDGRVLAGGSDVVVLRADSDAGAHPALHSTSRIATALLNIWRLQNRTICPVENLR